jgi:hypothetical protein
MMGEDNELFEENGSATKKEGSHIATVQMFGNNPNESIFYSGRDYEQIEVRECLLSFSAESLVLFAIQKYKD